MERYKLQVSPVKSAQSGSTEYFDLTFQTGEKRVRGFCSLTEKGDKINKFQQKSQSCIIGNVIKPEKSWEFRMMNNLIVKEKF